MRIATWNINSVRLRVEHVLAYLRDVAPDVLCLQEIKCQDDAFPRSEFEAAGYNVAVHGQKSYNGVAILSKAPMEWTARLPGDEADEQARYLEAVVPFGAGAARVGCLYLPNGNPLGTEKYKYKLAWMDRLIFHAREMLKNEEVFVLAGDYNVIPDARDVYDPALWTGDALYALPTRQKFRELLALGFTDALRATTDEAKQYTFWDYQAGCWPKNQGLRIDHLLLSPQAADRLIGVKIDRDMRAKDKPSDHTPVRVELRD
ncbi:exodeoxyribonuclease-3 [Rhodoblastus acidophilus]|uniref:exodeoxyribonuclease III n=1 Tax=Rhodoblastus acidophilus TaxID=1074 RepID=UPI002225A58E|nr:exodeoxyribonuclease III [Rhodoblastus acidophilus]MCW2316663.1 exodeoxyribonuclease-3 [Rhodoblastus acidophilus]